MAIVVNFGTTSDLPISPGSANANRGKKTVQVFGLSADPPGAGVGISRENPLQHPPNLVGYGTFLPAGESFRIAKKSYPGLKAVGVAWNPAESNSRAFTESARERAADGHAPGSHRLACWNR
jgi:ABC-type uncharacterized transport system substrate-binding protein